MRLLMITLSWASVLLFAVPLALMLMLSLRTGDIVRIAGHAALLVTGAAIAIRFLPDYHATAYLSRIRDVSLPPEATGHRPNWPR